MNPSVLESRSNLWKAIGPGILVACTAVGASHLVWSTRAGADFGWSLLGLVLLANLLKFPFFLYGQRYTAATGESLLAGYHRLGVGYVYVFLTINILTGAINIAGIGMVTGALLSGYGFLNLSVPVLSIAVLAFCGLLILLGRYRFLDGMAKVVMGVLIVATFAALALAAMKGGVAEPDFVGPSPWTWVSFAFLISLLGWMPAPVDLSAWSSLWMFSREKQTGHFATVKESGIDFYLGYSMGVLLAVGFVGLGALVMFGSGESFSGSGVAFAQQLVNLYAQNIGDWSRPLILTAAFITMFSTSITALDGYPRSLAACCSLIGGLSHSAFNRIHQVWIVISLVLASGVILFWAQSLIHLLTFAAVISFLTSPILAAINFKVMCGKNVPKAYRPGWFLHILSWSGLAFFLVMTLGCLYVVFWM